MVRLGGLAGFLTLKNLLFFQRMCLDLKTFFYFMATCKRTSKSFSLKRAKVWKVWPSHYWNQRLLLKFCPKSVRLKLCRLPRTGIIGSNANWQLHGIPDDSSASIILPDIFRESWWGTHLTRTTRHASSTKVLPLDLHFCLCFGGIVLTRIRTSTSISIYIDPSVLHRLIVSYVKHGDTNFYCTHVKTQEAFERKGTIFEVN